MSELFDGILATNIISLILVVVTGFYVVLTWKIAKANNRMIDTMTTQFRETVRPYVTASLAVREEMFFCIGNKKYRALARAKLSYRNGPRFFSLCGEGRRTKH